MKGKEIRKKLVQRYLLDGFNGMTVGLFCTLIVGLMLKQIGSFFDGSVETFLVGVGTLASVATGGGIGAATAYVIKMPRMVIFSSFIAGMIGANASAFVNGTLIVDGTVLLTGPGDPLGAFLAALVGMELGNLVSGKTRVDIIVTPMVTMVTGGCIGVWIGPTLAEGMNQLGEWIQVATTLQPFWMGMILSVVMGLVLTGPLSSAALSIILGLSGLPAGAATVGCASQMIGFAVASFRENKWDGFFAQGFGTSMLQMSNIVKNPLIWIPPTLTAAILGPLSTMVFKMENNPAGGGMGTSGLIGQFMTWQTMAGTRSSGVLLAEIILLHFVLPAVLTLIFSEFMRKKGWIAQGDMKLDI